MKKYIRLFLVGMSVIWVAASSNAQETMTSSESVVNFDAGKNIEAENKTSKFIIRDSDDSLVSLIVIKDFIFPNSLMQEHFNENYIESDKYPEASFSGKLKGFKKSDISSEVKTYEAKGKLTIHGVERGIKFPVTLLVNEEGIVELNAVFNVQLEDHKIKIPKVMFVKIAEEAEVKVTAFFKE